jgi:hypothetical protein
VALNLRLKTRRGLTAVVAAAATMAATMTTVMTAVTATSARAADPTPPDHLVIAAVWGANSDSAQWTNDWIELYNPTDTDIALGTVTSATTVAANYSLCYRGNTATTQKCSSNVQLSGTVKAHHYFFVWYANAHSPADDGTIPAGFTPDLDAAVATAANGGQQGSNMGGCNTGGQVLLLDPNASGASDAPSFKGDLSSATAKADGVVDGVGWTKASTTQPDAAETNGATPIAGFDSGTTNGCVIARNFTDGVPVDTDTNRTDFSAVAPADFTIHSQISDHVAVAPIDDAEISRNEDMTPIHVQGQKGTGALSYAAEGLPDGVSIDPSTGIISGTPAATDELKAYPVTVTVTDSSPTGPETATTSFTLTVSNELRVDPVANVSVHKGADLTPIQVSAHGGTPDYTYAATGLPDGVTIDPSTGIISGTPTDTVGHYSVHVTVTDSGVGAAAQSASVDFTLVEQPKTTPPADDDPLAGLKINEVKTTGTPANDWVELYNTGAAITAASVNLVTSAGDSYRVPTQDIAAGGYVVVDGADLDAAGLDLADSDTLDLTEADDTVLDETSWTSPASTSWARYPDGTGDFAVSQHATKGEANAHPASLTSDHLVISEVNGDQSGVYDNNWFELYNPTDEPISLGTLDTSTTPATVHPNYYMCYASAGGQTCTAPYQLYGTVYPHHHFLVAIYDAGSTTLPSLPAGVTPDIDFGSTDAAVNPSQQAAKNIGGYSTGGQFLLLDASVDTTGVYPTAANDTAANDADFAAPGHVTWALPNGNLADPSVNPSPIVDAMGFSKTGTANAAGAEGRTGSAICAPDGSNADSCVHSAPVLDAAHWDERIFKQGIPQDTNDNAADFIVSQRDPISQSSEHVVIAPVSNAEISVNESMNPIKVKATKVWAPLTYSATGLPAGVSIDPSTGVISGTPDSSDDLGDYPVSVTVTDGVPSDTATTTFTLTLSKVLRLDPIADVSVHEDSALTDIHVAAHGGTPGYTYAATGLPVGVTIDPSTGVISGTPSDALGHYSVHVTVGDSAVGDAQATVSQDFTFVELPPVGAPAADDPLAGLTINEVEATGTPAKDWVELYNTGADLTGASLTLENSAGDTYQVPTQDIAAHRYVVVDGADLAATGFDLAASDTLYLTETDDDTLLDQTTWTSFAPTSWARTTDGSGSFGVSGWATKGEANSGAPKIDPNDLLISEVNYDNNSTDYYEYSEITNTTDHPIDFAAYDLTLTKSGAAMTLHDPSDTSGSSPLVDPVIPAHGTQLFWWDENQYLGVKTTAQFLANYGLPASTPVVLVQGFSSLANSGGDHSYYLSVNTGGSTLVSRAYVDTPCAANTLNGSAVCTATNGNYAEHYQIPTDRTDPDAAVWYNSLHSQGDDINYPLKSALSSPGTVDLEQLGFTRAVTLGHATGASVELDNGSDATVDLSGYVLQTKDGSTYTFPADTSVASKDSLTVSAATSGLNVSDGNYVELLAPQGYDYTDGLGLIDTTGPLLQAVPYGKDSGGAPVIDETTGLPLPPAGGLYRPAGVSANNGTVYVSNTGDNVFASLTDGSLTTVAGSLAGYGDVGDEGDATDALLYQPGGTAEDAHGDIFIADSGDNVIREITPDGTIHRFAGTGAAGGDAATVTSTSTPLTVNLWHPDGVAVDSAGNVFIADTFDNRILEVTTAGTITVVAGTGKGGYTGDGAAATSARLALPAGVAVDAEDDVYIADSANNVVRRVDAGTGVITTVAGDYAAAVATNDCLGGYAGDGGPATSALLNDPQGVALDGAGDLFIADTFNNAIREVTPDGTISTLVNVGGIAGAENLSPVASGTFPASTRLNTPYAVAVDPVTDVLYLADTRNSAIAKVLHVGHAGDASGPLEPADQVAVTGSGIAAGVCAAATNGPVTVKTAPAITGTPAVGSTLTANPGTWTPTPDSFSYQWLRDGVAIAGATKATYAVTAADGGHVLTVSVTAVKEDFASTSATSAPVSVPAPSTGPGAGTSPNPALQHAKAKLAKHQRALHKDKSAKKKAMKVLRSKHASRAAKAKAHQKIAHLKKKIHRLKKKVKADKHAIRSAS